MASTALRFSLRAGGAPVVQVYDLRGREVPRLAVRDLGGGRFEARWDAAGLPAGTYVYRVGAAGASASGKLIHLR